MASDTGGGAGDAANATGAPQRDETLQHPRCVYQVLKRHYSRYTPEAVSRVCGMGVEEFLQVARTITENSGRERTTAWVYSVGWTHHSVGAQYIRGAAILQTLLGNMGRPGGGILALRGHASIQGSTDVPTLYDLLPGYIPMPNAHLHDSLRSFLDADAAKTGFWGNMDTYMVSLLKAWWGDAATAENDWAFDYMPRLTGDHGTYGIVRDQIDRKTYGYFVVGENPAVGHANGKMQRLGLANLEWLVVRDMQMIETATFWKDGPEIETEELRTEDIGTEVFFLPCANHTEKAGTFTNTQRLLQWRREAVHPPGDARSELHFYFHLGKKIREKLAGSTDERDRPLLDLTWDYPTFGVHEEPDPESVLGEINGYDADGNPLVELHPAEGGRLHDGGLLDLHRRVQDGVNQADRRKPGSEQDWVAAEWGWAWPANRRTLYNRASADAEGQPWSERKAYVWWDAEQETWTGHDVPDFEATKPPSYVPAEGATRAGRPGRHRRVHHADRREGVALRARRARGRADADALRAGGVAGGEPAARPAGQPGPRAHRPGLEPDQPLAERGLSVRVPDLPAHRAPHRGRHEPVPRLPLGAAAGVLLRGLPRTGRGAGPRAPGMGDARSRRAPRSRPGCS